MCIKFLHETISQDLTVHFYVLEQARNAGIIIRITFEMGSTKISPETGFLHSEFTYILYCKQLETNCNLNANCK